MRYRRFGKFNFFDYNGAWIGISVLLIMEILIIRSMFILTEFSVMLFIGSILVFAFIIFLCWTVIAPNNEKFSIDNGLIITGKRNSEKIIIPDKIVIVITYADISSPFFRQGL